MSKRGLSDVVTTVLLIMLVLAAVVIIWNFMQPFINSTGKLDTQAFTTKLSVPENSVYLDPDSQTVGLSIQRDAGDGDLTGFVFGIEDPSGSVRTFRQNFTLNEYEMRNFEVNYSQYQISDVVSITITPIFRNNNTGDETLGQPIQQPIKNKTSFKLPSGLVAHWKFDGNWVDSINGLNGGAVGSASFDYANKKVGQASGNFTGSATTYVSVPDNSLLNPSTFTVVAWVRPNSLSNSNFLEIVDKSSTGAGYRLRYNRVTSNWEMHMNSNTSNGPSIIGTGTLNQWEFIASAVQANSATIYYNSQSNSSSIVSTVSSNAVLQIGQSINANIDEVMFFNRALTSQEIDNIRTKYK